MINDYFMNDVMKNVYFRKQRRVRSHQKSWECNAPKSTRTNLRVVPVLFL